jgi:hypothetical protein
MEQSLISYLQQLEILVFFCGHTLLYLVVNSLNSIPSINVVFKKRIRWALPYSYAMAGVLFIGFEMRNMYPDLSPLHFLQRFQNPFLFFWAMSTLLFWLRTIHKFIWISFLHSLVFFYFLIKDLIWNNSGGMADIHLARNNMNIYFISLLLHFFLIIFFFLFSFLKKQLKQPFN